MGDDAERIARLKRMMAENIPGAGFWDVAWLVAKVEASLTCGAVYGDGKEWPYRLVCVRAPQHKDEHRGHPESEAWEWEDDDG